MPRLTSNLPRDPRGRFTGNRASFSQTDDLDTAASTASTAAASTLDVAEASSSPNVPGGLPRAPSPPISSSTPDHLPTNFSLQGAECQHLLSRFSDDLSASLLPAPGLSFTSQLTSATAREEEQPTSATTPTQSSTTARPDTPPTPFRRIPSWPQIYSFDQPPPEQPDFDQPSSDSYDNAPIIPTLQPPNPTQAPSAYQTFTFPLNVLAPQATTNISTLAPQPTQPSTMAVTGPATMPPPQSRHTPSFTSEGGDSLDDFLCEYEELANSHRLMEQQKVDWVIRYVDHSQCDLWKSLDGYTASDWVNLCNELQGMYLETPLE